MLSNTLCFFCCFYFIVDFGSDGMPIAKFVPRLAAVKKGRIKQINYGDFTIDKQHVNSIMETISYPTCQLKRIRIAMNTLKSLNTKTCYNLGKMMRNENIDVTISSIGTSSKILHICDELDTQNRGYLNISQFVQACQLLNPFVYSVENDDEIAARATDTVQSNIFQQFRELVIRQLPQNDRVYCLDFYQNAALVSYDDNNGDGKRSDITRVEFPIHWVFWYLAYCVEKCFLSFVNTKQKEKENEKDQEKEKQGLEAVNIPDFATDWSQLLNKIKNICHFIIGYKQENQLLSANRNYNVFITMLLVHAQISKVYQSEYGTENIWHTRSQCKWHDIVNNEITLHKSIFWLLDSLFLKLTQLSSIGDLIDVNCTIYYKDRFVTIDNVNMNSFELAWEFGNYEYFVILLKYVKRLHNDAVLSLMDTISTNQINNGMDTQILQLTILQLLVKHKLNNDLIVRSVDKFMNPRHVAKKILCPCVLDCTEPAQMANILINYIGDKETYRHDHNMIELLQDLYSKTISRIHTCDGNLICDGASTKGLQNAMCKDNYLVSGVKGCTNIAQNTQQYKQQLLKDVLPLILQNLVEDENYIITNDIGLISDKLNRLLITSGKISSNRNTSRVSGKGCLENTSMIVDTICDAFESNEICDDFVDQILNKPHFWHNLIKQRSYGEFAFIMKRYANVINFKKIGGDYVEQKQQSDYAHGCSNTPTHPLFEFIFSICGTDDVKFSQGLQDKYKEHLCVLMNTMYGYSESIISNLKQTHTETFNQFHQFVSDKIIGNLNSPKADEWYTDETIWDIDALREFAVKITGLSLPDRPAKGFEKQMETVVHKMQHTIAATKDKISNNNNNNSEMMRIADYVNIDNDKTRVVRLLCLGIASSGKSTLFKQIKKINGSQFKEGDKSDCRQVLRSNLLQAMLLLLRKSSQLYENDPVKYKKCEIDMNDYDTLRIVQVLVSFNGATFHEPWPAKKQTLSQEQIEEITILGQCIGEFWSHTAIQTAFTYRNDHYAFATNMDYFFNKSNEIFSQDYIPTDEDLIKVRIRTIGNIDHWYRFGAKSPEYRLLDVGGTRNERKKWILHFENVTAVAFTASLSSFAEVLYEDVNYNAMIESIKVFDEVRNSKWVDKIEIFIFFTKLDIFKQLILDGASLGDDCFKEQRDWGYLHNSARDANGDVINPNFDEKANKEMYISDNRYPMWKPDECKDQLEYNGPKQLKTDDEKETFNQCIENQLEFIKNAYLAQTRKRTIGNTYHYMVSLTNIDDVKTACDDMHQKIIFHQMYPIGVGKLLIE